jgi:hypothetical protein
MVDDAAGLEVGFVAEATNMFGAFAWTLAVSDWLEYSNRNWNHLHNAAQDHKFPSKIYADLSI